MQANQKPTPAIEKILEAVPTPKASELDWANGEIECDTVKLDKPYGYQLADAIAVGSAVDNLHGISGKVDKIVWVASKAYYRVRVLCAGNPNKKVAPGDYRYIIITNGVGTTR